MYFYYFGIILTCLFIYYHFLFDFNKETFKSQKTKQIYCVGDSMLNNARYVGEGESVLDYLQLLGSNSCNYVMLAKDGARLSDAFQQVDSLDVSESEPCMVLSVGGNDVLSEDAETLSFFQRFLELVKSIHVKFDGTNGKAQLFVLNLYYPAAKPRFHDRIRQWNAWLDDHAVAADYTVIRTDSVMTEGDDICYKIEPSAQGGEKIAGLIIANTC
jgi:hypothetical protein